MSISISDVIQTLTSLKLPSNVLIAVETQLENLEAAKAEEKDSTPKAKNQLAVIALDPTGVLSGVELTALVVQVPESQDLNETLPRLYQAVYDQRAAAKRKSKRGPIASVADAADGLKRGYARAHGLTFKTKVPVRVLVSSNVIPSA